MVEGIDFWSSFDGGGGVDFFFETKNIYVPDQKFFAITIVFFKLTFLTLKYHQNCPFTVRCYSIQCDDRKNACRSTIGKTKI